MKTLHTSSQFAFLLIGPILACWPAASSSAQTTRPARSPLVRIVDLDVGESIDAVLHDESKARVKLLEVTEQRDEVARAVRASQVRVEVNGQPVQLTCATYHLPVTVAGVQIDCPCTRAYAQNDARERMGPEKSGQAAALAGRIAAVRAGSLQVSSRAAMVCQRHPNGQ